MFNMYLYIWSHVLNSEQSSVLGRMNSGSMFFYFKSQNQVSTYNAQIL